MSSGLTRTKGIRTRVPYSVPLPPRNFFWSCSRDAVFDCSARFARSRADRALEPAYFVVARRRKGVSARSSSARRRAIPCLIAPLAALAPRGSRLGARLLRRRSQTKRRVRSLLLSTAARDPVFDCSARCARSARIAPWSPPTSSSLADEKACPLAPPQHGGARSVFDCSARSAAAARPHSRQRLAVA